MSSVEQRRKCEKLGQAMNSLQFLLKFVVRSRFLFSNLNGGKGAEPFEAMLREVRGREPRLGIISIHSNVPYLPICCSP